MAFFSLSSIQQSQVQAFSYNVWQSGGERVQWCTIHCRIYNSTGHERAGETSCPVKQVYFQPAVVSNPPSLPPGCRLGGCRVGCTVRGQVFLQHFIRLHLPVLGCRFIDVRNDGRRLGC
jgi:hypothetical protein